MSTDQVQRALPSTIRRAIEAQERIASAAGLGSPAHQEAHERIAALQAMLRPKKPAGR